MTSALEPFDYNDGDVTCKGRLALPPGDDLRPGVVVFHDIQGVGEHPIGKATRLAEEFGYLALAADVYGNGQPPEMSGADRVVASWLSRPDDLVRRASAAVEALKAHPRCNGRIGAIGFCFGGATVLALVRSGLSGLQAAVSFHGVLGTAKQAVVGQAHPKTLVLHGADDPFAGDVPFLDMAGVVHSKTLPDFLEEMSNANVDCQVVAYAGVVHAFTIPNAGDFGVVGAKYDELADKRSWESMGALFREAL
ncbi:dienelactone hydrolase family protein [Streptomyces sp. GQFP]|uniref:dienelactone hydrolase family protein n=1 Tax=Streptomyces sp. GQFP TaxID=2907545 RepID=UPI001F40F47D|nr:dienelactone hydrolase family protein [Streptomyces sp. GQFP]UIX29243.1 dienelactone hydrolase family protein [Streptomyces sp. GQFP]